MNQCAHCGWTGEQVRWTRNLCRRCYEDKNIRLLYPTRDGRAITEEEKSRKGCAVKGCDEPHKANAYCVFHNGKFTKFGDPLGEHPNETKRKERLARNQKLSLDGLRECFDCEGALPFASFTSNRGTWDGSDLCTYCRDCARIRSDRYKEQYPWVVKYQTWASHIKENYNATPDDYCRMWVEQDGCCRICKGWYKGKTNGGEECLTFAIDHCHTTNRIRGLLCRNCNTGLGHFRDDTATLQEAINYLREAA